MSYFFKSIFTKAARRVCFFILFSHSALFAQTLFKGILINKADSSAIPYAAIKLVETGNYVLTNDKGEFEFSIPEDMKVITFDITAIGSRATVHHTRSFLNIEKVYVDVKPETLTDFVLVGLSAEDVVKKAVAAIPRNYADSSYFSYSSYREYEKVNDLFRNLVEAKLIVMFRLSKARKEIRSKEAYAVTQFRRSKRYHFTADNYDDSPELLVENPVYYLEGSSLDPAKLDNYEFRFDTTVKSRDYYVVHYSCNTSSSERHGIINYNSSALLGESHEIGTLTIERGSFAIRKIERVALRYPGFSYFGKPNLIIPERKFFEEFIKGELTVEYEPVNGKWYLKKLDHQYTNEYFEAVSGIKAYVITDFYEWNSDSVSRSITDSLVNKFYYRLPEKVYHYDKDEWAKVNFPFFYCNKDSVYNGIGSSGPIEDQFYQESIQK